jgi:hypothetical protein
MRRGGIMVVTCESVVDGGNGWSIANTQGDIQVVA